MKTKAFALNMNNEERRRNFAVLKDGGGEKSETEREQCLSETNNSGLLAVGSLFSALGDGKIYWLLCDIGIPESDSNRRREVKNKLGRTVQRGNESKYRKYSSTSLDSA